jgi:hypothetical protein
MEEVLNVAEEGIVAPQTENHSLEAPKESFEDKQERNFKELRRQKQTLERELREQREEIERLKRVNTPPPAPDEIDLIDDSDLLSKGHVKQLIEKQARIIAQQQAEEFHKKQQQSQFMVNLKQKYSDFEDIVNPETLSILEEEEPELASSIAEMKDPYKMGLQSYKYIKSSGIDKKVFSKRREKEVSKAIEKNEKAAQTPLAYEKRPMAQAFQFGDAEKKALQQEMYHYASQAGFSY